MLRIESRETVHFEAKLARGGLPRSLWETYSAFANSDGGEILLGIEERPDKTLRLVGVEHPERTTIILMMPERVKHRGKTAIKNGDKGLSAIGEAHWARIEAYLSDHDVVKSSELAEVLGLRPSRVREFLGEMVAHGRLVIEGANRNRTYRLKK